jgi:inorganic triphosphatase YgiF
MSAEGRISSEREFTLLICSGRPEELAEEIASISAVAQYSLGPGELLMFQDLYFDSPGKELAHRGYVLRIRTSRQTHKIALKGPELVTGTGWMDRPEFEAFWSPEAWRFVATELESRGVHLDRPQWDSSDPSASLESAGLEVVQLRETKRFLRDIFLGQDDNRIAELAVDCVTYRFGEIGILHSELEVEGTESSPLEAVNDFVRQLMVRFEGKLRPWKYSKFVTGMVIQELLSLIMLNDFLDQDSRLRPEGYAIIERRLT